MELWLSFITVVVFLVLVTGAWGIESPEFTVVQAESDFEIRLYRETTWMSAVSTDISFHRATREGFHRLFQYIEGANLNNSRVAMTAPVLTSIVPDAGPLHSSAYYIRFYVPAKFQSSPPLPLPELDLRSTRWPTHCIAVRKFSGFARDYNVVKEAEKLAASLSRSPWANSTEFEEERAYSIAQYNSPFRFIGRVNEVWVDIDGSQIPGCEGSYSAAY